MLLSLSDENRNGVEKQRSGNTAIHVVASSSGVLQRSYRARQMLHRSHRHLASDNVNEEICGIFAVAREGEANRLKIEHSISCRTLQRSPTVFTKTVGD